MSARQSSGRYRTIVADPPWKIAKRIPAGGRRARATEVPYEMLALDEIKAVPVADLACDDAHLYLWCTREVFREGIAAQVARAWGFEPVGEVIWGLRNPGMGTRSLANDHEPVLVAVRGSLAFTATEPMGVYFWKQPYAHGKIHSAKPEAFLDHVAEWSPEPRVELFARRARFGWDYWGNESLGTAELLGWPAPCKHRRVQYDAASNALFCWGCCQEVDGAIA